MSVFDVPNCRFPETAKNLLLGWILIVVHVLFRKCFFLVCMVLHALIALDGFQ